MYAILEASALTGVSRDMIRHYEKLGLIVPTRSGNGYRQYADSDLNRLVMIRTLNNLGVSLKTLGEALRLDDVRSVISQLEAESVRLKTMQDYVAACKAAAELSLSAFRQYAGQGDHTLIQTRRRILYSRDRHNEEDYVSVCRRLAEANGFFQYYHRQDLRLVDGEYRLMASDVGLLIYDPLPIALSDVEVVEGQQVYLTTLSSPRTRLLSPEELAPHLKEASKHCSCDTLTVLTYQVFEPDVEHCVVCMEIPLEHSISSPSA